MSEALSARKHIYQVEPCPETPSAWIERQNREYEIYGKYFKNKLEFEFFVMLPLTDEQRVALLYVMKRESDERIDLRTCKGEVDKPQTHRNKCMNCVLTQRPIMAEPFYQ